MKHATNTGLRSARQTPDAPSRNSEMLERIGTDHPSDSNVSLNCSVMTAVDGFALDFTVFQSATVLGRSLWFETNPAFDGVDFVGVCPLMINHLLEPSLMTHPPIMKPMRQIAAVAITAAITAALPLRHRFPKRKQLQHVASEADEPLNMH